MKVLLVHNFYRSSSPSGEDAVYQNEKELLTTRGVEVVSYERSNDEITGGPTAALGTIWSARSYDELKAIISRERPDIAHFHNIWYLISPSAYHACKEAGVPVVQTLHNFRMFCTNGLLMRDGKVCEECVGGVPWRGVWYGCYRNSRLYSLPVVFSQAVHRTKKTWTRFIDGYIALTEFGKRKFIQCGLPEKRVFVKPNFLSDVVSFSAPPQDYAVFIGRFSREKGIEVLISALNSLEPSSPGGPTNFSFKLIGDGPLMTELRRQAEDRNIGTRIEFTGRKTFAETMDILSKARFLVMPSVCYENFPLAIREAFACGRPVIASNLGAMAELVEEGGTGLLFEPGNPRDLADKISWMIGNEAACLKMGRNARAEFLKRYTAGRNFDMMMEIYARTIEAAKGIDRKSGG
jgi:glycosyltransferase involved in cell wall biosynthesis